MIKIGHIQTIENENIQELPIEVFEEISDTLAILDDVYGADRDIDEADGGYIIVVQNESDLEALQELDIVINELIPEYVEEIRVDQGEDYTNTFILTNNEYGINIFIPYSMTPQSLIDEIVE